MKLNPQHTEAQIELILLLTDQFAESSRGYDEVRDSVAALSNEYDAAILLGNRS